MEVCVRTRGIDWNEDLQNQVERRILYAVDRHSNRIDTVSVLLSDLNGPRGGVDKLCQLEAHVRGAGPVLIAETGDDLLAVVGRAARRLGYRISGIIDRRRRPSPSKRRATIRIAIAR